MKTVLITGGAKRLGRALVEKYAADGWRVLFTSQWSFEEGTKLAEFAGDNTHCIRAQASNQINASLIAQWVMKHTNKLDLLICNASTFKKISVADSNPHDIENLFGSNLIGPFFLAQQCLHLLKAANGSIINIADAQALSGLPMFSVYGAAKAGLISLTKSMALEFAPNVRVNAILPGTLQWPEHGDEYPAVIRTEMVKKIPLCRIGEWSELVQAVQYLESAEYVTGALLPIDGGRSAVY